MPLLLQILLALAPGGLDDSATDSGPPASIALPAEDQPVAGAYTSNVGERFSLHDLNYALAGSDEGKMQASFKYRLLTQSPLYLAFTSTVIWEFMEPSGPFRDVNFAPELFWRFDQPHRSLVNVDAGYLHYSNGQAGPTSRSWDRLYARTLMESSFHERPLELAPEVFIPIASGESNKDIAEYLGYWQLDFWGRQLLDPQTRNLSFNAHIVSGKDGMPFHRGSVSLGLTYEFEGYQFNPALYLEYFNGYGDSLIQYDEHSEVVRFGLLLN